MKIITLSVEHQKNLGLCAAFSTNKGLETNYAFSNGKLYNFSERYIDYMTSPIFYGIREIGSLDNNITGDGVGFTSEVPLLEMQGSVLESYVPYKDYSVNELTEIMDAPIVSKLNSCIYFSKVAPSDYNIDRLRTIIKSHLMKYGSMYICIATPDQNTLYNSQTSSYFKPEDYNDYNLPPFIVEYKDGNLCLSDGNHRYRALRKLGIDKYYVVIWGSKYLEDEFNQSMRVTKR